MSFFAVVSVLCAPVGVFRQPTSPNLECVRQKETPGNYVSHHPFCVEVRTCLPFFLWSQYSYVCFIQCPGFSAVLCGNDRGKLRLPHLPRNRSGLSCHFEVKIRNLIKQGNCIYYVEKTPSSRSKSLHEINFKCLSNNLKENFKNVSWYLIHKKTNLQGICLNVLKNYPNDFS